MQTAQNTLMQIVALAMKILGTKNESELLQALSKMSEVGRTKFIKQCQNIILTGNTSKESIQLAQLLAQQALNEGPEQEYTLMAKYGTSLNRYYFGGRVKTYDGNYMDLKKPINKDQIDGKEAIGTYKGQWMYLNKNEIAVPKSRLKDKGYDGTAHINRAYNGMLMPRPYKYDFGGTVANIVDGINNVRQSTIEYGKKKGIKQSYFDAAATKLNSWIPGLGAPFSAVTDFLFNPDTAELPNHKLDSGIDNLPDKVNYEDLTIEALAERLSKAKGQEALDIVSEIKRRIPTEQ